MKETTRTFLIGLFSIIALIGFAALLMMFGELEWLKRDRYQIDIHMNVAAGLRPNSQVELNGVHIGSVQEITLKPEDDRYPVRVVALIKREYRIPSNVQPHVDQMLIGGSAVLQLVSSPWKDDEEPTYLAQDGTAEPLTAIERSLFELISDELDERTKPLLEALDHFNELSDTYIAVGDNINQLLEPQDPARIADGEAPNIHTAVGTLNAALDDGREVLRLANRWLDDEQLQADIRKAVTRVDEVMDAAINTFEQYTRLASKLEADTDEVVGALVPVAEQLADTLAEIRRVTREATEGRGTLAQLLNNPDLYDSLNDAAMRAEQALTDLRLFIQKAQSEGLPLRHW